MEKNLYRLRIFHLTGKKIDNDFVSLAELHLVPAQLSRYRDLTQLRYDYPLVLLDEDGGVFLRSLSSTIDRILQQIAPQGIEGERIRRNLLALETQVRSIAAQSGGGSLSKLWDAASDRLLSDSGTAEDDKKLLKGNLARGKAALRSGGEVIDCDAETPALLFSHAWRVMEKRRAQRVLEEVEKLSVGLSGILRTDYLKSSEGLGPDALRTSVGSSFEEEFDFSAMSSSLIESSTETPLPSRRAERIRFALSVLGSQRFFAAELDGKKQDEQAPYRFVFDSCTDLVEAYRERIPAMVDFIKAVRIAELELSNEYDERTHDPFFDQFDQDSLRAADISLFPSYLLQLDKGKYTDGDKAALIEILSSDLPVKVVFQPEELFRGSSVKSDRHVLGGWDLQLAAMAMSLNRAYVLQAASSNLYLLSERIWEGLSYEGPALFTIFSGSTAHFSDLPPYLISASAAQSRAFPAFAYNPAGGEAWAARFHLDGNPQVESSWPVNSFDYEDQDLQRVTEELPFTIVDFAASDRRLAENFVRVPRANWHEKMIPAGEYLQLESPETREEVPYILMVDDDGFLHRVVMTHNIISAARHYANVWRNLQEFGGINNSHALALLDKERALWEQEKKREIEELKSQYAQELDQVAAVEAPVVEEAKEIEEAVEERGPIEEAFIETPRCNSCDECTKKNDRMFAYNENKQAYIKDIDAGTFRDLVEAAELCKVAIIHPGKPRNPDEPNLEELVKRAEPFN